MAAYVLTNPSESELEAAVYENLYAAFRSLQAIPGCELEETDSYGLHHTDISNPMFRGAWKTRLSSTEIEATIDQVVRWFQQRKAQDFFWWTDKNTQPVDLTEHLIKHGFDGNLEGEPGMVANLHQLNEAVQSPKGLKIKRATESKTLFDWRDAFAEAYEMEISGGQAWIDATLAMEPQNVPWDLYVGYLDGKPVASSMLFNGAGVAGIYAVGTVQSERNKGIGSEMTLRPLLDARKEGYNFGVLFSSRSGYSVYERLGFREVASRIGIYILEMK